AVAVGVALYERSREVVAIARRPGTGAERLVHRERALEVGHAVLGAPEGHREVAERAIERTVVRAEAEGDGTARVRTLELEQTRAARRIAQRDGHVTEADEVVVLHHVVGHRRE